MLTSLFSLCYVPRECDRFLHVRKMSRTSAEDLSACGPTPKVPAARKRKTFVFRVVTIEKNDKF